MSESISTPRRVLLVSVAIALFATLSASLRAADNSDQGELVFNGKDFTGWTMRNTKPGRAEVWSVVSDVKLNPNNHRQLMASGKGSGPDGIMFRSGEGDSGGQTGTDIMTEKKF